MKAFESPTFGNSLSLRVDGAIGAMSLSPNGRDAVLAGRKGLFIIDLDDPFTPPRWLHHITSWEVADVQWSPHHHVKPSWCVSTSNQKALLWDLSRPSTNAIQNVLHRHTRAISDIHFHPQDPELLATCSIDTFVFTWDMRTPRRPVNKLAQWRAGATQVKWNSSNPYQIASSHHHSFYLWDSRKGASPVLRVDNAHAGKINGLDFSGSCDRLITCSNDHSIKFWDMRSLHAAERKPAIVIHTDYPVARARRLPFGQDNCCGIMPVRGGENAVHIVNYKAEYDRARSLGETVHMDAIPDYSFRGHGGPMKDFLWRQQHENYAGFAETRTWKEYQLVTWSPSDFDLKLWPHEKAVYDVANYNPSHQVLLGSLVGNAEDSSVGTSPLVSHVGTPEAELNGDYVIAKGVPVVYKSYVDEPETSFADVAKESGGDVLSRLASYAIKTSHQSLVGSSQLNHLSWISGVRMGRPAREKPGELAHSQVGDEGPANLGEEISIVGHKFSKLRFEKISVSTGHIEISLRGPLPALTEEVKDDQKLSLKPTKTDSTKRGSVSDASVSSAMQGAAANPVLPVPVASSFANTFVANALATSANNGQSNSGRQSAGHPAVTSATKQSDSNANPNSSFLTEAVAEQPLIFIRLDIHFPKSYPFLESTDARRTGKKQSKHKNNNRIRFDIEETHELTAAVKQEMLTNLEQIAHFYSNKYHKYCLEPCLRYLMGEKIELDDSLMIISHSDDDDDIHNGTEDSLEVGDENWVDDLIDQHEAAASFRRGVSVSGDEEDEDADLIFGNNDKMTLSMESSRDLGTGDSNDTHTGVEPKIKHDSTPLPKGCGAVWTRTGELVCFFIPKTDETDTGKITHKQNAFKFDENGFGLKTSDAQRDLTSENSTYSKESSTARVYIPADSEDDSDIDRNAISEDDTFSVNSASSRSSDDSFSNDWDEMLQDDIPSGSRMPGMFRGTVALGRRIRVQDINKSSIVRTADGKSSAHRSSAVGDAGSKSNTKSRKKRGVSVVSILDFRHLIPDKYELACDYRVLGDPPELLAKHNSAVAYHHGYHEIGKVWRIVEMLLVKEVQMRELTEVEKGFFGTMNGTKCDFYWGNHPLGHAWIINKLFAYFEKHGNLQMLAMLSCLLFENLSNIEANNRNSLDIPIHTPYPSLPPRPSLSSMREHGFLSSEEAVVGDGNLNNQGTERHNLFRKASTLSTRDTQVSRPLSPDYLQRSESPSLSVRMRQMQSSSFQNITSPYMENFSLGTTPERNAKTLENSKPPSRLSMNTRKGSKGVVRRERGSMTLDGRREKPKLPPSYTIEIKNADSLDLFETRFSAPLLMGIDKEKLSQYREQYAEMLYTWGLPLHRIKILKFNHPQGNVRSNKQIWFDEHSCTFGSRNRKAFNNKQSLLSPITPIPTARENAWNSKKRDRLHYCGYCGLLVTKRVVICTKCEHILHSHCAAEWWTSSEPGNFVEECPTGCGCSCLVSG